MLVGVDHPSCSDWYSHRHLELRRFYDTGARWWDPMRDKLDPSSESSTAPDVCRFARLARVLAVRRWEQASRFVDRMPEPASWTPPSESPHVRESGIAGDNHSAVL